MRNIPSTTRTILSTRRHSKHLKEKCSKVRAVMCWAHQMWYWTCDNSGRWFEPEERSRAVRAGNLFLACYQYLALNAIKKRQMQFHVMPKLHYFKHMIMRVRDTGENPRFFACWMEEDAVGKYKKIGNKVHKKTFNGRFMTRYKVMISMRWQKRRILRTLRLSGR